MLAWLRDLPETREVASKFSYTSSEGGHRLFETKGCIKCHLGSLSLDNRLHDFTLTDIAVDMWNHAPRMIQPAPVLAPGEMRQLLSYPWMRQFIDPSGSGVRGKQVFTQKKCAGCHAGGAYGAPRYRDKPGNTPK